MCVCVCVCVYVCVCVVSPIFYLLLLIISGAKHYMYQVPPSRMDCGRGQRRTPYRTSTCTRAPSPIAPVTVVMARYVRRCSSRQIPTRTISAMLTAEVGGGSRSWFYKTD